MRKHKEEERARIRAAEEAARAAVLALENEEPVTEPAEAAENLPETGDTSSLMLWTALLALCGAALLRRRAKA